MWPVKTTFDIILWCCRFAILDAFTCYSCANDFVIWHWASFFSKRNYGLSSSEQACASKKYASEFVQSCHSSCYSLNITGTNRQTGKTAVVGYARGCSEAALSDSKKSPEVLNTLFETKTPNIPFESDNIDFLEHWCFCEGNLCNRQLCYSLEMPVDIVDGAVNFAPDFTNIVICSLVYVLGALCR